MRDHWAAVRAVIFTYPPDYVMASYAAESLRRCGIGVTLAVDKADPKLVVDGCEVVRTSFPRNGNLNGMETVIGQLETLRQASDGSHFVLKVDSDSMVFATTWLDGMSADVVGLRSDEDTNNRSLYGFCYAVAERSLDTMIQLAREMPANPWCPEDIMMATIAERFGKVFTYRHKAAGTRLGAFRWTDRGSIADWRRDFDALCFQRGMQTRDGRRSDRTDIRKAMKDFLSA